MQVLAIDPVPALTKIFCFALSPDLARDGFPYHLCTLPFNSLPLWTAASGSSH